MHWTRKLSLRRKITLVIMVNTFAALCVASIAFAGYGAYRFKKLQMQDLNAMANVMGTNSTAPLVFKDPGSAQDILQALAAKPHILAACIYDPDGKPFAVYHKGTSSDIYSPPPVEDEASRFTSNRVLIFQKITFDGETVGHVFIEGDTVEYTQLLEGYLSFFGLIVAAVSLGAFVMAARLQRPISDPILELASTARSVTGTRDYSIRAGKRSEDEVGVLIDGFNEMLEQIQNRDAELRQASEDLERRVDERTTELAQEVADRKRAQEGLHESEEKIRLLLDSTAEAIYGIDRTGKCTFCNPATYRLLGYQKPEDLLGKQMHTIMRHTRADGTPYPEQDCNSYVWLQKDQGSHSDEEVFWRADGTSFPAEYWAYPIRKEGITVGAVVTFFDITERKQVQRALLVAKEAAEAASLAKSEFLANMSHEIRTPLNGIIGMTELTLQTRINKDQRDYLNMVKQSADSLLTVINDILDFSKIEAGKMSLESAQFDLRETLEETIRTFSLRAAAKGLELICDIPSSIPQLVLGDTERLRQVLVNLLGNAIKFTDRGEIILQVQVQQKQDNNIDLHFAIRDTGIGVPKEKQEMIFESFVQADGSSRRRYGGTGLGLTISTRLVAMMGGRIWLESEPGEGSTFHFTAKFQLPNRSEEKRTPNEQASLAGISVLVVDDNPTNRRILEQTVVQWGMKPTVVASGWAAIAALRRAKDAGSLPPIVLMDAQMPQLDGFGTAAKIKQDPELLAISIIMLTSGGQRGDADHCREMGISAYLTKPVRQQELRDAIVRVLGLRQERGKSRTLVTRHSFEAPHRYLQILLAEDNLINQELAVRTLSKRGHTVTVAGNGKLAVEAYEKQAFDLVLMDIQMPEMDGFEATAAIRQKEKSTGTHIPIIAMTAHAMKGDRELCLAAGMDAYMSKPVSVEALLHVTEGLTRNAGPIDRSAEPVPAPAAADLDTALSRMEGDEALLADLAKLFCEESPRMLAAIQAGIERKDAEALERAAHTLRGSVAMFAAQQAIDFALKLERLGRAKELGDAEYIFADLAAEIERVRTALEAFQVQQHQA